jgi:hypothetical protein
MAGPVFFSFLSSLLFALGSSAVQLPIQPPPPEAAGTDTTNDLTNFSDQRVSLPLGRISCFVRNRYLSIPPTSRSVARVSAAAGVSWCSSPNLFVSLQRHHRYGQHRSMASFILSLTSEVLLIAPTPGLLPLTDSIHSMTLASAQPSGTAMAPHLPLAACPPFRLRVRRLHARRKP